MSPKSTNPSLEELQEIRSKWAHLTNTLLSDVNEIKESIAGLESRLYIKENLLQESQDQLLKYEEKVLFEHYNLTEEVI